MREIHNSSCDFTKKLAKKNKTITNRPNAVLFIFYILFIKTLDKLTAAPSVPKLHNLISLRKFSLFNLPKKKKTVIFLRAPYKNKLARLNIVRFERTAVFSVNSTSNNVANLNWPRLGGSAQNNFFESIIPLLHYNLSSYRIKHVKTSVFVFFSMPTNFTFNNFI